MSTRRDGDRHHPLLHTLYLHIEDFIMSTRTEEEIETIALMLGLDEAVVEAGLEAGIEESSIGDAYVGRYASDEDFAYDMHMDSIEDSVPSHLLKYIDWDKLTRDTMYDYYECNGYYFSNNY